MADKSPLAIYSGLVQQLTVGDALLLQSSSEPEIVFKINDSTGTLSFQITADLASRRNMFLGKQVGEEVTTGNNNVCLGHQAGRRLTEGVDNVFMGQRAGETITTGIENFGLGAFACNAITTESGNIGIGANALINVADDDNVAIGRNAMTATTGTDNVAVGASAGRSLTTGAENVFIGCEAGRTGQTATVSNCIGIGAGVVTTADNEIILGNTSHTKTTLRGDVYTGDGAYETLKRTSKTANYTVVDETLVLVDASSAAVTITLPAAADLVDTPINIKKTDASGNAVTVDGNGSETIDGSTTAVISTQYDCITIVSDGTEWWII